MRSRRGGDALVELGGGPGPLAQVPGEVAGDGVGVDGAGAREQHVEHGAQGVEVRTLVDGLSGDLLRRHEGHGAHEATGNGELGGEGALGGLDHPEVRELGDARGRDEHVGGLEVAVDEAVLVHVVQGLADAAEGGLHGGRAVFRGVHAPALHQGAQVRAVHVLHGDPGVVPLHAGLEHAHHVGVVQVEEGQELAAEAAGLVRGGLARVEDLDGHHLATTAVGSVHRGHAAHPRHLVEVVGTDVIPGERGRLDRQGHGASLSARGEGGAGTAAITRAAGHPGG